MRKLLTAQELRHKNFIEVLKKRYNAQSPQCSGHSAQLMKNSDSATAMNCEL